MGVKPPNLRRYSASRGKHDGDCGKIGVMRGIRHLTTFGGGKITHATPLSQWNNFDVSRRRFKPSTPRSNVHSSWYLNAVNARVDYSLNRGLYYRPLYRPYRPTSSGYGATSSVGDSIRLNLL